MLSVRKGGVRAASSKCRCYLYSQINDVGAAEPSFFWAGARLCDRLRLLLIGSRKKRLLKKKFHKKNLQLSCWVRTCMPNIDFFTALNTAFEATGNDFKFLEFCNMYYSCSGKPEPNLAPNFFGSPEQRPTKKGCTP